METDTLAVLLRLRRLTLENARAVLADILQQQDDAQRELTEAEQAIRTETMRATDPGSDDDAVEAFAGWLPAGRRRADAAQSVMDHAVSQASQARTVLALARTSLEAAESVAGAARGHASRAIACRGGAALGAAGWSFTGAP